MPNVPLPEENDNERTHAGSIPPLPQSGEAQVSEGEQTVAGSHPTTHAAQPIATNAMPQPRAYVGIIGRSCRQIRQGRGVGRRRNAPVIRSVGIGARSQWSSHPRIIEVAYADDGTNQPRCPAEHVWRPSCGGSWCECAGCADTGAACPIRRL